MGGGVDHGWLSKMSSCSPGGNFRFPEIQVFAGPRFNGRGGFKQIFTQSRGFMVLVVSNVHNEPAYFNPVL